MSLLLFANVLATLLTTLGVKSLSTMAGRDESTDIGQSNGKVILSSFKSPFHQVATNASQLHLLHRQMHGHNDNWLEL